MRFSVSTVCVNALVRFCAGGDQRWSSLPRPLGVKEQRRISKRCMTIITNVAFELVVDLVDFVSRAVHTVSVRKKADKVADLSSCHCGLHPGAERHPCLDCRAVLGLRFN